MTNPMSDPDVQPRPPRPKLAIVRPKAVFVEHDKGAEDVPESRGWEFMTFLLGMLLGLLLFLATMPATSQTIPHPLDAHLSAAAQSELRSMVARSGAVFAGQVTQIRARTPQGQWLDVSSPATAFTPITSRMLVAITFTVEQGIRGATDGSTYTLREWGGLWTGAPLNAGRYRLGQRALLVLYPERNGVTSPVGGTDGVLPLRGSGAAATVDIGWIQARLPRAEPSAFAPSRPVARPISSISAAVSADSIANMPVATRIAPFTAASAPADDLIAALRFWTASTPQP